VIGHYRVIDDEVDGHDWIDALRIAATARSFFAHCRKITDQRNAGRIVHHYADGPKLDVASNAIRSDGYNHLFETVA
jgi:transposase